MLEINEHLRFVFVENHNWSLERWHISLWKGGRKFPITHSNVDQRLRFFSAPVHFGFIYFIDVWARVSKRNSNFHRNVVKGKVTSLERSEIVLFLWHFSFSFCSLSRVCVRLENLFSFWFDVFIMESETPNNTFLLPVSCSTPHLVLLTIETSFRRSKRVEESSRFVDDLIERIQNYIRLCLSLFI